MARLREYPRDLHDTHRDELHMRVDLHSTVGGSDKVYILTVVKHKSNGTWQVVCYNGRRGHGLTTQPYSTYSSYQDAKSDLRTRQRAKESKGYKFIHEEEQTSQGTLVSSPGQVTQAKSQNALMQKIGIPGQAVKMNKLKEVVQPISKGVLTKLSGMKAMPNMNHVDTSQFLKQIRSDDYVVMNLETMRLHYAFLEGDDWILYDAFDSTKRPTPEYFTIDPQYIIYGFDPKAAEKLNGLGWLGITDNSGKFIITDLCSLPGVPDVYKKPWTARRTMMNVVYDQLFPGVDPYDINNKLQFSDYIYEDKTTAVNFGSGIFVAFNVNRPLNGSFYVTTK